VPGEVNIKKLSKIEDRGNSLEVEDSALLKYTSKEE
jgi:hypothetical protein